MKAWLKGKAKNISYPKNSEELAVARFGTLIYKKLFYHYTKKQWGMFPKELNPLVISRIHLRFNFNNRYFTDKNQAMPKNGYHKLFINLLNYPNITIKLNTDFFKIKNRLNFDKLFYTGAIDEFFDYKFGKLQYRSNTFEFQTVNQSFFQPTAVVNYPESKYRFIRITEPKHATGQRSKITTIIKEYASWGNSLDYPVPTDKNQKIFQKYAKEAKRLKKRGIYFIGRLANYKYINMDQAVKNALDLFDSLRIT
jgi:UDP-galactopyranose mutase